MRQAPLRRTTTTRKQSDRRLLIAVPLVLAVVAAFLALRPSGAGKQPASACAGEACTANAVVPVATATSPAATLTPAACPYCGQDPDRWKTLTSVAPPQISGTAATVLEGSCGRLIYGLNQDARHPPASIAKIVTALVVAGQAKLSDRVDIKINGWDLAADDGSSIAGLIAGTNVSVEELLYALLLPSGNDAALALADYLGGPAKFVGAMNDIVAKQGLKNTHLADADGRDAPDNYTSALDIVLLGRQLMANPELRQIAGAQTRVASWDNHTMWNTNYFVYGVPGATGVKFGFTEGANETVVGSALRDGREIFVSVLDSDFGYLDGKKLIEWAFANTKSGC